MALATLAASSAARAAGANERVSVGIVGPGGRGSSILRTFFDVCTAKQAELTAVCDRYWLGRQTAAALAG